MILNLYNSSVVSGCAYSSVMNLYCPKCHSQKLTKDGTFRRSNDSKIIQRYKCKDCLKRFSASTHRLDYRHKKRRINPLLFRLLASGVSQRRAALLLGVHRVTIARKFKYLAEISRIKNQKLQLISQSIQFDDLVTKESSKLKPLSISVAVDVKTRCILSAQVSTLRAFGHLAREGKRKYPDRKNNHKKGLRLMFDEIAPLVHPQATIRSDEHKFYEEFVKEYFPQAKYKQYKSEKGCIAGQGELKKVKRDPLFAINHTCAMLRANINRLFRRTWCTTKDSQRLKDHLDIFMSFYNFDYLKLTPG